MKKNILLFGAGKSATVLIDYLLLQSNNENWLVHIADVDAAAIERKTKKHVNAIVYGIDIVTNVQQREKLIAKADVVISLLPPQLHILVAKDCVALGKHLLTASYIDDNIKALEKEIKDKQLLFLYELGLDPGIDHMSAMEIIDAIKTKGGTITCFKSHCGGLVAPESDNNPWHYKISWNPRNVVMAGSAGAVYKQNNVNVQTHYHNIFASNNEINIDGLPTLAYYANRDSLSYMDTYQLQSAHTFMRTTLRYADFIKSWNVVVALKLTDDIIIYNSDKLTVKAIFEQHIQTNQLKDILHNSLANKKIAEALFYLQIHNNENKLAKGDITMATVLQYCLEQQLALAPTDRDMIVMLHEIDYVHNNVEHHIKSHLVVKGADAERTAMAKTVGLPLGIAAKLLLNGTIQSKGLKIPIEKNIYIPVLKELQQEGILFVEKHS
jgi:saccharopine dehydrogenase (NADP+, L-glutamate forming)